MPKHFYSNFNLQKKVEHKFSKHKPIMYLTTVTGSVHTWGNFSMKRFLDLSIFKASSFWQSFWLFLSIKMRKSGGRHSSVDPSAPTVLQPQVRIPSFYQIRFELWCGKDENKSKKRLGLVHFLKMHKSSLIYCQDK